MTAPALQYLSDHQTHFQHELIELLRIPSISHDSAYAAEVLRAAHWLAEKLRAMGVNNVELMPTAGHPVVYGEWLGAGPSAPTVLVYGHYDVQSPEPLEDWQSQPFEPEIRNDNLYARGASDMKGQTLASLNAIEALLKTDSLPVNVKFLLEGEEEVGSKNLAAFLGQHREKFQADFSLNTDAGGMPDADTPSICYGLRGGVSFVLTVSGPAQDLHSGEYGGTIHNPIHVLSQLIAEMHDAQGHVTVPGFYDGVREIDADEHAEMLRLPFDEAFLLKHSGAPALWGEPEFLPAERISARPTVEVVMFTAGQPKSAIPAKASARFACRLVPDQDPAEVLKHLQVWFEAHIPTTVTWTMEVMGRGPGIVTDRQSKPVQAMRLALQNAFGKPPIFQRSGGGIGAVLMFKHILGIDSVLTGFSLYDDNFHGPNEKLHLPTWRKGMQALVQFFHAL